MSKLYNNPFSKNTPRFLGYVPDFNMFRLGNSNFDSVFLPALNLGDMSAGGEESGDWPQTLAGRTILTYRKRTYYA